MKNFLRSAYFVVALLGAVALEGALSYALAADVRQRIAAAHGIDHFDQVEQIQYTFNVKFGDKNISRSWIWEPKADKVTFKVGNSEEKVSYRRKELTDTSSEKLRKIDAWFINDNYWLLFPFRVAWDDRVKVEDIGSHPLPDGDGSGKCVVVIYPSTGGYTPGDVYELFLDNGYKLTHWVYLRGGAPEPRRSATWEDYRAVGPLTLSLMHRGAGGNFRLWFTDVGVKLVGASGWSNPK